MRTTEISRREGGGNKRRTTSDARWEAVRWEQRVKNEVLRVQWGFMVHDV